MAQLAVAAAGGGLGFLLGGPAGAAIGFQLGAAAGALAFGAGGQDQLVEGPRLTDLKVQTSAFGTPIPIPYGAMRVPGQVIWSAGITEHVFEDTEDAGKGGGGPETTTRTYSYTASWASLFCRGPILGVSRIWFDSKLMFDIRSAASADTQANSRTWESKHVTLYRGNETQTADPTIEASEGTGSVPGFRGLAYIVFEDVPLADFGNRIPNVTVEVFTIGSGTASYVTDKVTVSTGDYANTCNHAVIDRSRGLYIAWYARRAAGYPSFFAAYDYINDEFDNVKEVVGNAAANGCLYKESGSGDPDRILFNTNGKWNVYNLDTFAYIKQGSSALGFVFFEEVGSFIMASSSGNPYIMAKNSVNVRSQVAAPSGYTWEPMHIGISGEVFAVKMLQKTADNQIAFCRFTPTDANGGGSAGTVYDSGYTTDDYAYQAMVWDPSRSVIWAIFDWSVPADTEQVLFKLENTGEFIERIELGNLGQAVTRNGNDGFDIDPFSPDEILINAGGPVHLFNILDNEVRTITTGLTTNLSRYDYLRCRVYDAEPQFNISGLFAVVHTVTLDCADPACETLEKVVKGICLETGLTVSDIDASQLSGSVCGYLVGQQSARAALENLQKGFFFDGIESQGQIKFIPRGGASAATIDSDDMADTGGPALNVIRGQELELPKRFSVVYIQKDKLYQPGEAHAQRVVTNSIAEANTDLRLSMTAAEAAKIPDVLLYAAWAARTRFDFALPVEHLKLDPGDIVTLTDGTATYTVRLIAVTQEGILLLRCQGVEENPALYTSNATGIGGQADTATVGDAGNTTFVFLDIPTLSDAGNAPLVHFALGGLSAAWFGARLYRSIDNGATYESIAKTGIGGTIGESTDTLASGITHTWDETNSVNIDLENSDRELDSLTDLAILNGANAAALGANGRWEIIQFATATLEGDGTYTLSRLLRGRLGTEHNIGNHTSADTFVLLSAGLVMANSVAQSAIGLSRKYKPVTVGQDIADVTAEDHTYTGVNLKPWAPVHIAGSRDGSNNLTVTWSRRSRLLAAMLQDPVLAEASEAYEVDIMSGAAVLRTISATSETASYTAAQQTTDGLTPGDPVEVNIYQLSEIVGRGYAGNETV